MKKLLLFMVISLILQFEAIYNDYTNKELLDIAQAVEKQGLTVGDWEVIYRDKISLEKAESYLNYFEKNNFVMNLQEESHTIYTIEKEQNDTGIKELYKLIIPENSNEKADFTVTIDGVYWNEFVESEYIRQNKLIFEQFSTNSTKIFTCLTATESDIIENGLSFKDLRDEFNLLHSFTQSDKKIESKYVKEVYGYNPDWKNALMNDSNAINLQMVLKREENNKNLVTIGTPIILNEY